MGLQPHYLRNICPDEALDTNKGYGKTVDLNRTTPLMSVKILLNFLNQARAHFRAAVCMRVCVRPRSHEYRIYLVKRRGYYYLSSKNRCGDYSKSTTTRYSKTMFTPVILESS